jgi:hypothetical protein
VNLKQSFQIREGILTYWTTDFQKRENYGSAFGKFGEDDGFARGARECEFLGFHIASECHEVTPYVIADKSPEKLSEASGVYPSIPRF